MGLQTSLSLYICFFLFIFSKRWVFRLLCHCTFVSLFCLFSKVRLQTFVTVHLFLFYLFLKGGTSDFSVTVHLFLSFVFSKRWDFRLLCHCTFVFSFLKGGICLFVSFILSFLKGGSSDFSVTVHLFLYFVFSKRWVFRLLCHCTFVSFFCLF